MMGSAKRGVELETAADHVSNQVVMSSTKDDICG